MTVLVLVKRGTCIGQGVDVYPGEVVDLPDTVAAWLLRQGRAVRSDVERVQLETDPPYGPGVVDSRDPVAEHGDPRPARGRPRKQK